MVRPAQAPQRVGVPGLAGLQGAFARKLQRQPSFLSNHQMITRDLKLFSNLTELGRDGLAAPDPHQALLPAPDYLGLL